MESQRNNYAEWSYENISCWNSEIHDKCITCGSFPLDLYPRGLNGDGEHLIVKVFDTSHPSIVELSFVGSDGSLICKQEVKDPKWNGNVITLPPGPKFKDAVWRRKNKDILVLKLYRSNYNEVSYHGRTILDVVERCIKRPTRIFSDYQHLSEIILWCFYYKIHDEEYLIVFSADLEDHPIKDSKIHLKLSPKCGTNKRKCFICACITIFDGNNVISVKSEENTHVFRDKTDWKFFSISQIKNFLKKEFHLTLDFKFISGGLQHEHPLVKFIEPLPKSNTSLKNTEDETDNLNVPSNSSVTVLLEELMCLYQDQDFSDIQLKCGDVTFPVHKNILSVRSPVFKNMLSCDMREATSNSVDIVDLDTPTLARFLAFLYTGKVEDLQDESALKLYYAADKYQVPTLKRECADFLSANVSIANVCDILFLANKHQDDKITSVAHDFILKNFNEVLSSNEWELFMKSEPLLAVETVTHFAKRNVVRNVNSS